MAGYFFQSAEDGSPLDDPEGDESPVIEAAQSTAIDILTELLPCRREAFNDEKPFSANVKDETGRLIIRSLRP